VDRFAANTLRTLAIVLISIFVIGSSLLLLLLALCFGALGNMNGNHDPNAAALIILLLVIAVALIAGGVFAIAKLSKGIVRDTPEYQFQAGTVPTVAMASPGTPAPPVPPATPSGSAAAEVESRPPFDLASHLSPGSRIAIRQLALAIAAKLAVESPILFASWTSIYGLKQIPSAALRVGLLAWGLASIAPLLVLLYALLRHPGPRAFAYSLVIPALHIFFGFFGHSASILFLLLHAHPGISPALSLLSTLPWFLDILILYLAWKAIRCTGVQPNSTRLIVAAAVIFIYTSLLPVLAVFTIGLWR